MTRLLAYLLIAAPVLISFGHAIYCNGWRRGLLIFFSAVAIFVGLVSLPTAGIWLLRTHP